MIDNLDALMASLGASVPAETADTAAMEAALSALEGELGVALPDAYRAFVLRYGGTTFARRVVYPIEEPCPWGQTGAVEQFFGLSGDPASDLRRAALETYPGRIPDETVPIAEDAGGNLVLLGVEGMVRGQVFFWDHEHREVAGRLEEMAADLEAAGVDLRYLDAHALIRRWEVRFPDRRTKPAGYGNVYRVAASFPAFLASLRALTSFPPPSS